MSWLTTLKQCVCSGDFAKIKALLDVPADTAHTDITEITAKLEGLTVPVQVYSINAEVGYTWERYGPRDTGNEPTTVAGWEARWGGPVVNGVPTNVDGSPTTSGVESDVRFSIAESGVDDHKLTYRIRNTSSLPLEIKDTDARAESLRVYLGCECTAEMTYERYQSEGAPYTSDGQNVAVIPPNCTMRMCVLIHDRSADFSGFNPIANYAGSEETVTIESYQEQPANLCTLIDYNLCEPEGLSEGEAYKPFEGLECKACSEATDSEAEEGDTTPTLQAAGRKLRIDDFSDQENNTFRLQIGNATNNPVNWQALLVNKPYATINNLVGATIVTSINADGTYNHLLTGTAPIPAFGQAVLTGDQTDPFGDSVRPSMYCETV